jgi:hypothetical protein
MTEGFVEFEFDLPDALLMSLTAVIDGMAGAPLTPANVLNLPEAQGVYVLLHRDRISYVGKTDAEAGLRNRLERHAWTIQHRRNLSPADVRFKAVRIFVFTAMDLETQLIRHYRPAAWNNSGFGSNDPGRERDTTNLKPDGFDANYPIDIDHEITLDLPRETKASVVVNALKSALPYTFRVEGRAPRSRQIHADFENSIVSLPKGRLTTRLAVESLVRVLPPGWQATALPSRIIVYRESREYSFGETIARS